MQKSRSLKYIIVSLVLGGLLTFSGCQAAVGLGILAWQLGVFDKDENNGNHAPQILTLTAVPNTIQLGGATILTAVAVDLDSGDSLSYLWTCSKGSLATPNDAVSSWVAPTDTSGTYYINVTVSDGKDSVTGRVAVVVQL